MSHLGFSLSPLIFSFSRPPSCRRFRIHHGVIRTPTVRHSRQYHNINMRFRRGADPVVAVPNKVYLADGLKTAEWKDYDCMELKGKVVLAVNVASLDEQADYHYGLLVKWHEKYKAQGFEILAFPNNWYFGQEEPWPVEQVKKHVQEKYGVKFVIMNKSDIDANPIFKLGQTKFDGDIEWNFHGRFLFGRDGYPAARFGLLDEPEMIERTIEEELDKEELEDEEVAEEEEEEEYYIPDESLGDLEPNENSELDIDSEAGEVDNSGYKIDIGASEANNGAHGADDDANEARSAG